MLQKRHGTIQEQSFQIERRERVGSRAQVERLALDGSWDNLFMVTDAQMQEGVMIFFSFLFLIFKSNH